MLFTKSLRFLFYSLCPSLYKFTSASLFQYQGDEHYIKEFLSPFWYTMFCEEVVMAVSIEAYEAIWRQSLGDLSPVPFRCKICIILYRKINSYFCTSMSYSNGWIGHMFYYFLLFNLFCIWLSKCSLHRYIY